MNDYATFKYNNLGSIIRFQNTILSAPLHFQKWTLTSHTMYAQNSIIRDSFVNAGLITPIEFNNTTYSVKAHTVYESNLYASNFLCDVAIDHSIDYANTKGSQIRISYLYDTGNINVSEKIFYQVMDFSNIDCLQVTRY